MRGGNDCYLLKRHKALIGRIFLLDIQKGGGNPFFWIGF